MYDVYFMYRVKHKWKYHEKLYSKTHIKTYRLEQINSHFERLYSPFFASVHILTLNFKTLINARSARIQSTLRWTG